jgi:hypothetical protein
MCSSQTLALLALTAANVFLFSIHLLIYRKFIARLKTEHKEVWFDLLQRRQKTDDGDELTVSLQKYLYFGEFTIKCNKSLISLGRLAQANACFLLVGGVSLMYFLNESGASYASLKCLLLRS